MPTVPTPTYAAAAVFETITRKMKSIAVRSAVDGATSSYRARLKTNATADLESSRADLASGASCLRITICHSRLSARNNCRRVNWYRRHSGHQRNLKCMRIFVDSARSGIDTEADYAAYKNVAECPARKSEGMVAAAS